MVVSDAPMEHDPARQRAARLRLASAATAGSIAGAVVVDTMHGLARYVGVGIVAAALVAVVGRLLLALARAARTSSPTVEQVLLVVVSLVSAGLVLDGTMGGLEEWRYTAAAVAATAPNWHTIGANLLTPRPA